MTLNYTFETSKKVINFLLKNSLINMVHDEDLYKLSKKLSLEKLNILLKYFPEDGWLVVIDAGTAGFDEMLEDTGLGFIGSQSAGGEQAEDARIGGGDAQFVVAERSHAGLNNRISYSQQVSKFCFKHNSLLYL